MSGFIDAIMSRSRTVLSILAILLVAGLISYDRIPKEAQPDIPIPMIIVNLSLQGISPEDGERLLVKPMEKELQSIEGLEEMTSYAAQGVAGVILEFDVDFDKDAALADVRDKVDIARAELPDDAEEPVVQEFNASTFPILVVGLYGEVPERTLFRLAERLQDRIEALSGVLEAQPVGKREELLEVIVDPSLLESYGVSQAELIEVVTRNNRLVAAGNVDTGEGRFAVKVPGLFETASDVFNQTVKASGEGVVTLGDIADIRRSFMDRTGYALINGERSVALNVSKRIGANIIETSREVRQLVREEAQRWPGSVRVAFIADGAEYIDDRLKQLQDAILTAICLVMIVVVGALGLRSGLLVGVAIPSSFLIGFFLLSAYGLTLNFMVNFGLLLSVGILVDGAIVVVEYADRKMAEGLRPREAYALAARRMFWPIVSSTATTLAAFFPMLLWPGVPGKFMSYLPLTLIFILSASLLVALIFLPVLGAAFGRRQKDGSETLKALAGTETGDLSRLGGLTGGYARAVARLVRRPGLVIAGVGALLVVVVGLYANFNRGVEFFVQTEPERLIVLVGARGNLSVEEARDLVLDVEERIARVEGIETIFTATQSGGGGGQGQFGMETPADMIGQITVELSPWEGRPPGSAIVEALREQTSGLPGLRVEVREEQQGPPTGKDLQLELTAIDFATLREATSKVSEHLQNNVDGLIEVEDTRPLPGIEWELQVDREQAGRFGADITTIGATVQLVTNGVLIGQYRPDDAEEEIDIRARFPGPYRNIEQLDRLRITTPLGQVPIGNFVKRVPKPRVSQINRVDGQRIMEVRANTAPGVLADDKVREVRQWLETGPLDPEVTVRFRGADEEQQESAAFLQMAMLGALFLMFVILLTQFNSFYHAVLILSTVVLSTVGVLVGMLVMGQTFSIIMTGTGIVALAGIVVNNNIVLIDTYQRLRGDGFAPLEAIVRTAAQRFRPVLLTTVTTMCGLLPMMFALNVDLIGRDFSVGGPVTSWWVQLATAVVFGLGFATILTLALTPALLAAPHVWSGPLGRLSARVRLLLGLQPRLEAGE
ncbi:MAG: efflux RND transporter permease subunit [Alphaproteobacteria bacterium]